MAAMNDDAIIAYIRECLENGNYDWDSAHLDQHMIAEGFDEDDIAQAVIEGKPFEIAADRSRWLFCGTVPFLREYQQFRDRSLHVDVQYEEGARVNLVTAYRPLVEKWETETRRRQ
ncbi:MAG: hypothetical protein ACR2M3_06015 [Thermomicrobiales bacterium]